MKCLKYLLLCAATITLMIGNVKAFNIQSIKEKYPEFEKLDVVITKVGKGGYYDAHAGSFRPRWKTSDIITLDKNLEGKELEYVYVHEIGHAIFHQLVETFERLEYCKVARVNVSAYASQNCNENWAEAVAVHFYGLKSWHPYPKEIARGSAQDLMIKKFMSRLTDKPVASVKKKYRKRTRKRTGQNPIRVVRSGGARRYRGPSRRWNPVSKWTRRRSSRLR